MKCENVIDSAISQNMSELWYGYCQMAFTSKLKKKCDIYIASIGEIKVCNIQQTTAFYCFPYIDISLNFRIDCSVKTFETE